jgi:hypothetical protein
MAPLTDNFKRAGAAIQAHYRFLAWLRIETIALDVLEALIEAPTPFAAVHESVPKRIAVFLQCETTVLMWWTVPAPSNEVP